MISVVIPAKNAVKTLEGTLSSVSEELADREFEIVLVDNGSNDATSVLAAEHGCRVLIKSGTVGECRVAGAKAANGGLLLFVDADQVLTSGCVDSALDAMNRESADAVVLPERPLESAGWFYGLLDWERQLTERVGAGIPRLVGKERYLAVFGEMPGRVFAEDFNVGFAAWRIAISTRPIRHREPESLRALLRKYYAYGSRAAMTGTNGPHTFGILIRLRAFAIGACQLRMNELPMLVPVLCLKALKGIALLLGYILHAFNS